MARPLVALCYVRVFLPPGVKGIWSPCLMAHLLEVVCNASLLTSMELVCLGQAHIVKMLLSPYMFATLLLGRQLRYIAVLCGFQCIDSLWKSASFTCC